MSSSLIAALRPNPATEVDLRGSPNADQQRCLLAAPAAVPDPRDPRAVRYRDGAWPTRRGTHLIARLTAEICELCDSRDGITVHHVKRLADLNRYSPTTPPAW